MRGAPRKDAAGLTAKRKRFCEEYVIDLNGAGAARRAGYSEAVAQQQASVLLNVPEIKTYIAQLQGKIAIKLELSAERVLKELMRLGYANMRSYMLPTADGEVRIDLTTCTEDEWAAIQEFTVDETGGTGDGERKAVQRVRLKLADKRGALELLGRHLRLFIDKTELSITDDQQIVSRLLAGRAKREEGSK